MSTLPLEVHEVLEEEYVSMYGSPSGDPVDHATFVVLDKAWACSILRACDVEADAANIAERLAALVNAEQKPALEKSPALSSTGRMILKDYDNYADEIRRKLHRRIVDEALCGAIKSYRDMELERIYAVLHARPDEEARTALCISGGGIRSATFALGVIQGLAGAEVLDKFDYLSTVSGGGYIGSWLSSWSRRDRDGIAGVQRELMRADTSVDGTAEIDATTKERVIAPKVAVPATKIDPEPGPVRHLREYSNYLSPRLGLTSADAWTIAALYIRNLLLNLLVLVPILALFLAFPRFMAFMLHAVSYFEKSEIVFAAWNLLLFRVPAWKIVIHVPAWTLLTSAIVFIGIGFSYLGSTRPVEHGRKAERKVVFRQWGANGRFLFGCVLPLTLAAISFSLFWARSFTNPVLLQARWFWWNVIGGWAAMMLAPFGRYYWRTWKSSAADRKDPVGRDTTKQLWRKLAYELGAALAGLVTSTALLVLLAVQVFDNPLQKIVDPKSILPILRPLTNLAPVSAIYLCLSVPLILVVFFIQASVFVGLSSKVNEEYDREWWGRAGAWLLMTGAFLGLASLISVFGPVYLYRAPVILGSLGGLSGLLAGMVGFSAKTDGSKKDDQKNKTGTAASSLSNALLVPLFVVILLAAISLGTTWLLQQLIEPVPSPADKWDAQFESQAAERRAVKIDNRKFDITTTVVKAPVVSAAQSLGIAHMNTVNGTGVGELLLLIDVALVAYLLSRCIGVNRFSMHAFYRNRLVRAYLGASRYSRDPDAFTGFDANDNIQMYELRPELLWPSHLINPVLFIDILFQKKDIRDSLTRDALLTGTADTIYTKIWYHLDRVTRNKIVDGNRGGGVIDSVTQHLNAVISDRRVKIDGSSSPVEKRAALMAAFPDCLPECKRSPMHVVNTALNLTSGGNLAWQQRQAESFTVSPLHSGSAFVGYRDSREYAGDDGISLGNAVTISGAAASPNQGYNSSPPLAFLLTLLNVRLGSWLGNPGVAGRDSYRLGHPSSNLKPMFAELLGSTTDTFKWIYLSDGGHFENLALYEMVLRRCRYIVVSDGGCDPKFSFEDLGNAIRKIRTDLGVPIDLIEKLQMSPRPQPGEPLVEGAYMAKATIRYSAIDAGGVDGALVYLKPSVYDDDYLPRDVYNYAQESGTFPHETTADQFFSESQFESYRALGRYVINVICRNYDSVTTAARAPYALRFKNVAAFVNGVPLAKP
jgi:hypothetical protein